MKLKTNASTKFHPREYKKNQNPQKLNSRPILNRGSTSTTVYEYLYRCQRTLKSNTVTKYSPDDAAENSACTLNVETVSE